jgi:predicted nucleotidyltransferase
VVSAILFGSAVNSKNYEDFDILLILKEQTPKNLLRLLVLIDKLKKQSKRFDFSLVFRQQKNKNKKLISLVPISSTEKDEILEYSVSLNNKVLFGKNSYKNSSKPIPEFFTDILLRQKISKEKPYKILKQYLFIGLLWKGIIETKENLLTRFDKEYNSNIFEGYTDLNKFLLRKKHNLKDTYNCLEKLILEEIERTHKNSLRKKRRPWTKKELFLYNIKKELATVYSKKTLSQTEKYLLEKQRDYEQKLTSKNS